MSLVQISKQKAAESEQNRKTETKIAWKKSIYAYFPAKT